MLQRFGGQVPSASGVSSSVAAGWRNKMNNASSASSSSSFGPSGNHGNAMLPGGTTNGAHRLGYHHHQHHPHGYLPQQHQLHRHSRQHHDVSLANYYDEEDPYADDDVEDAFVREGTASAALPPLWSDFDEVDDPRSLSAKDLVRSLQPPPPISASSLPPPTRHHQPAYARRPQHHWSNDPMPSVGSIMQSEALPPAYSGRMPAYMDLPPPPTSSSGVLAPVAVSSRRSSPMDSPLMMMNMTSASSSSGLVHQNREEAAYLRPPVMQPRLSGQFRQRMPKASMPYPDELSYREDHFREEEFDREQEAEQQRQFQEMQRMELMAVREQQSRAREEPQLQQLPTPPPVPPPQQQEAEEVESDIEPPQLVQAVAIDEPRAVEPEPESLMAPPTPEMPPPAAAVTSKKRKATPRKAPAAKKTKAPPKKKQAAAKKNVETASIASQDSGGASNEGGAKRRCGRKSMNYSSEQKRERNRAAVKKCRQRQALKLDYLGKKARRLETENEHLSDLLYKRKELTEDERQELTRGIQMDILLKIKEIFTQSLPKDFVIDAESIWDLNSVLAVSMPSRCHYGIESIKDFWKTSLRMRNKGKIRSFWAWLFRLPPGERFTEFEIEPFSKSSNLYFINWTTNSTPPLSGSIVIMFGHGHRVTLHVECFGWLIWRYLLTNEPFPEPPMD